MAIVGEVLHPIGKVKDFAPYIARIAASGKNIVSSSVVPMIWPDHVPEGLRAPLERACRYSYELRLHRARGYGALKAILDILAVEEPLTLTEISIRLKRTPGSTKDYLSWLEDVDLVASKQKRYSFTDPLLRLWVSLHCRPVPPSVDENGYGLRVPALVISPYARRGYIDHQTLSFDAYLKFIEDRFLGSARIDPATDGRPDPRPSVRENEPLLGDLSMANLPAQFEPAKYERMIFGLILIVMMIYRPQGILPPKQEFKK